VQDINWIRGAGYQIGTLENELLTILELFDDNEEPDPDRLKTTLVADVHTWGSKRSVLEVASGYLEHLVIVHCLPTGQWGVAVGPVFSYHEFEYPMSDRLTDEQWRELIAAEPDHGRPEWLSPP